MLKKNPLFWTKPFDEMLLHGILIIFGKYLYETNSLYSSSLTSFLLCFPPDTITICFPNSLMQLIDVKSGTKKEKGGDENNFESRELFF